MADRENDIPGFYRDPESGRYFRENPLNVASRLQLNRSVDLGEEKPPESTNVLQYLRARELSAIGGTRGVRQYYQMRMFNKKLINDTSLRETSRLNIKSVLSIKGSDSSIFGTWYGKNGSKIYYVVGEMPFDPPVTPIDPLAANSVLDFRFYSCYITDMCEGPIGTIVCLWNNPTRSLGRFEYLPRIPPRRLSFNTYTSISEAVYCCTTIVKGEKYAVGTENSVKLYRGYSCDVSFNVPGRCYCLCVDETLNLVAAGLHRGTIHIYDVRAGEIVSNIAVSRTCLMDTYFLDSGHIIVSCAPDALVKVDITHRKVDTEYFEHTAGAKKRPLSVANNLLCAAGVDKKIRIWDLYGGKPVHVIKPMLSPENEIQGWLHGDRNKTYLSYFEKCYKKVFEIVN